MISNVVFFIQENEKFKLEELIEKANKIEDFSEFYTIGKNSFGKKVLKADIEEVRWENKFPIVEYWNNIFNELNSKDYIFGKADIEDTENENHGQYGYMSVVKTLDYDVDFEE